MIQIFSKTAVYALLTTSLLGCAEPPTRPVAEADEIIEFGEEDKRAARVLSIGNAGFIAPSDDELDQALLCSSAIEEIGERLAQSGILTEQQGIAMRSAKTVYDQRVNAEKVRREMSETALATKLDEQAAREMTSEEKAQTAVACLQALKPEDF